MRVIACVKSYKNVYNETTFDTKIKKFQKSGLKVSSDSPLTSSNAIIKDTEIAYQKINIMITKSQEILKSLSGLNTHVLLYTHYSSANI